MNPAPSGVRELEIFLEASTLLAANSDLTQFLPNSKVKETPKLVFIFQSNNKKMNFKWKINFLF